MPPDTTKNMDQDSVSYFGSDYSLGAASPDQHAAGWEQLQRICAAQHITEVSNMSYAEIRDISDACDSLRTCHGSSTALGASFWQHMELLLRAAEHALALYVPASAQQEVLPGALSLLTTLIKLVASTLEERFGLDGALLLHSVTYGTDRHLMESVMTLPTELELQLLKPRLTAHGKPVAYGAYTRFVLQCANACGAACKRFAKGLQAHGVPWIHFCEALERGLAQPWQLQPVSRIDAVSSRMPVAIVLEPMACCSLLLLRLRDGIFASAIHSGQANSSSNTSHSPRGSSSSSKMSSRSSKAPRSKARKADTQREYAWQFALSLHVQPSVMKHTAAVFAGLAQVQDSRRGLLSELMLPAHSNTLQLLQVHMAAAVAFLHSSAKAVHYVLADPASPASWSRAASASSSSSSSNTSGSKIQSIDLTGVTALAIGEQHSPQGSQQQEQSPTQEVPFFHVSMLVQHMPQWPAVVVSSYEEPSEALYIFAAAAQLCAHTNPATHPTIAQNISQLVLLLSEAVLLWPGVAPAETGACHTPVRLTYWQSLLHVWYDICMSYSKAEQPSGDTATAAAAAAAAAAAPAAAATRVLGTPSVEPDLLLPVFHLLAAKVSYTVQEAQLQAATVRKDDSHQLAEPKQPAQVQSREQHTPLQDPAAAAAPPGRPATQEAQRAQSSSLSAGVQNDTVMGTADAIEAACEAVSSQWAQLVAWIVSGVSPVQLATVFGGGPLVVCAALEAALQAPCDSDETSAASRHAASRQRMARTVAGACKIVAQSPLLAKAAAAAACEPPSLLLPGDRRPGAAAVALHNHMFALLVTCEKVVADVEQPDLADVEAVMTATLAVSRLLSQAPSRANVPGSSSTNSSSCSSSTGVHHNSSSSSSSTTESAPSAGALPEAPGPVAGASGVLHAAADDGCGPAHWLVLIARCLRVLSTTLQPTPFNVELLVVDQPPAAQSSSSSTPEADSGTKPPKFESGPSPAATAAMELGEFWDHALGPGRVFVVGIRALRELYLQLPGRAPSHLQHGTAAAAKGAAHGDSDGTTNRGSSSSSSSSRGLGASNELQMRQCCSSQQEAAPALCWTGPLCSPADCTCLVYPRGSQLGLWLLLQALSAGKPAPSHLCHGSHSCLPQQAQATSSQLTWPARRSNMQQMPRCCQPSCSSPQPQQTQQQQSMQPSR